MEGPLDLGLRGIVRLSRFECLEKFEFLSGMKKFKFEFVLYTLSHCILLSKR